MNKFVLHDSWTETTINYFVVSMVGGASPTVDDYSSDGVLALNKGDIKPLGQIELKKNVKRIPVDFAKKHENKIVSKGAVIVTLRDLSQKADFLGLISEYENQEDALITQGMYALSLASGFSKKYLIHYSNSLAYREQVKDVKVGVTQVHLRNEQFLDLQIPLPPLAEQQQIAQKLDELLAQVDTLKARLDAIPKILKRFRQSVLAAAVSGRLTEEWRGEKSDLEVRKVEIIKEINSSYEKKSNVEKRRVMSAKSEEWFFSCADKIPNGWVDANLIDVTSLITCGVAKKPNYTDSGVPFLSAQNAKPFLPNLKGIKYISKEDFKKFTVGGKPEKGDVLYSRVGANFGEACQIPWDFDFAIYVSLTLIKPIKTLLNDTYLTMYLNSIDGILQSRGGILGSGIQNLNVESVRKYRVPLPTIEEQTEIVRRVEQLFAYADQIEQRVKDAQARVNHLTQSILAKAFRGELTADWRAQNPELISGENSAAALLERIKVEREAAVKPKRKGK